MTLKLSLQHRVLEYHKFCSNDGPGLTLTYFTARSKGGFHPIENLHRVLPTHGIS